MKISQIDLLLEALKTKMELAQDPAKAVNMSAYLRDRFACYGIKTPDRHVVQADFIKEVKALGLDHWDVCYALWSMEQREYHYVAVDILKSVSARKMKPDDHKNLEELITHHSWWDSVDLIATNYAGKYFKAFPEMRDPVIERWKNSSSMWLNRSCLIFQMKYGKETDFALLKDLIIAYQGNPEFFIQKAIGWSLRQYSKFNPEAVQEFVAARQLKGIAYSEAVKYL
jgi:3-methyladenine DNA glycosylase AlkD